MYMEKAQRFTFSTSRTSRRAAGSSLSGIGLPALLFHVLEGGKVFFAGADFDDVENVVDKNLSISDVAGVECFAGGLDDFVHGNSGHDDFDLDLGQEGGVDDGTSVALAGSSLDAAAHDLGHGHTGHAQVVELLLELIKLVEAADDGQAVDA